MAQQQQENEYLVVGDTLNQIRDEMNAKFTHLSQNVEQQLADLRQQLAQQKQINAGLKQEIQVTDQQTEEFKKECSAQTGDLHQINGFYSSNADDQAFANLLGSVVQRHQTFEQALQQKQYSLGIQNHHRQTLICVYVQTRACLRRTRRGRTRSAR